MLARYEHAFIPLTLEVFLNSMTPISSSDSPDITIPLHVEDVSIERREVKRDVKIHIRTSSHDQQSIDEPVMHEKVEIGHVTIGNRRDPAHTGGGRHNSDTRC